MGFLGALFGGQNPTLSTDINNAGNIMNFGTALGESDLMAGSDFYKTLLSGDPQAIGKLLGPQISNIQKQGQEQLNTAAEFGNRSGGTNAAAQTNMDTQRADVMNMISQLTGQAAQGVTGIGESALGTGLNANALQAKEAQQKMENEINSLFGNMISSGIGAAESFGLGKLGM